MSSASLTSDSDSGDKQYYSESSSDLDDFIVGGHNEDDYKPKKKKAPEKKSKGQKSFFETTNITKLTKSEDRKISEMNKFDSEISKLLETSSASTQKKKTKKSFKLISSDEDDNIPKTTTAKKTKKFIDDNSDDDIVKKPTLDEYTSKTKVVETNISDTKKYLPDRYVNYDEVIEEDVTEAFDIKTLLEKDSDGKEYFLFYLYSIYELTDFLYLFGKSKEVKFPTVCVRIDKNSLSLYFKPVSGREIECAKQVMNLRGCLSHNKDRQCYFIPEEYKSKFTERELIKDVTIKKMKFAFEDENIEIGQSLWVVAHFDPRAKISDIPQKTENYVAVYNYSSNLQEEFILNREIKGPTWVSVYGAMFPKNKPVSNCLYCVVNNIENIVSLNSKSKLPIQNIPKFVPRFNIAFININSQYNQKEDDTFINMINCITYEKCDIMSSFHAERPEKITFIASNINVTSENKLIVTRNEKELLEEFVNYISRKDIDFISSFCISNFDGQLLIKRLLNKSVSNLHKLGRINIKPSSKKKIDVTQFLTGRIPVDICISAEEFLYAKVNDINSIVSTYLQEERVNYSYSMFKKYAHEEIKKIIEFGETDVIYIVKLAEKIKTFPLTLEISNLSGATWCRVLLGKASYRSEALLAYEFCRRGYVIPDKNKSVGGKRETKYEGGHVLDPEKGFYDDCIIYLDYNSLYPSVIIQYNLSFESNENSSVKGVLPSIMNNLLEKRKEVKNAIKSVENRNIDENKKRIEIDRLNTKQLALKILANSMYGYLGFKGSRFPALDIAETITQKGRDALAIAIKTVNNMGYKIIYGDTDSVMINSLVKEPEKAITIARDIVRAINKNFSVLNMDIECIFLKMLLVSKKKYAALKHIDGKEPQIEIKGLDMVRRDWCDLTKYVSMFSISQFLRSDSEKGISLCIIKDELKRIKRIINNNGVASEEDRSSDPPFDITNLVKTYKGQRINSIKKSMFVLRKKLSSAPTQGAAKGHHHIQIALRLIEEKKRMDISQGTIIEYIISNQNNTPVFPEEITSYDQISLDWYLESQVISPLFRVISPFGECSREELLETVGLSRNSLDYLDEEKLGVAPSATDSKPNRIRDPTSFSYICPYCNKQVMSITNIVHPFFCSTCDKNIEWKIVENIIIKNIKEFIKNNHTSVFLERTFNGEKITTLLPLRNKLNNIYGRTILGKTSTTDLYNYLRYFKKDLNTLETNAIENNVEAKQALLNLIKDLREVISSYMNHHKFDQIRISDFL